MRCSYCGSPRHPTHLCPKTHAGSAAWMLLRCSYYGGKDHDVNACPRNASGGKGPNRVEDRGRA